MEREWPESMMNHETRDLVAWVINVGSVFIKVETVTHEEVIQNVSGNTSSYKKNPQLFLTLFHQVGQELKDLKKMTDELATLPDAIDQMLTTREPIPLSMSLFGLFLRIDEADVVREIEDLRDKNGQPAILSKAGWPLSGSITDVYRGEQIGLQFRYGLIDEDKGTVIPTNFATGIFLVPVA